MDAFSIHGGRLSAAKAAFPNAPAPWIDLSTGVNPAPYPVDFSGVDRTRLPDPVQIESLEQAAAEAFGFRPACVLACAGADAGLRLLAACLEVEQVAVVEPTYSAYRQAWAAAGATVAGIARAELEAATARFDLVTLANPNNPDGDTTEPHELMDIGRRIGARGGWLVVDEAFVEAASVGSLADVLGRDWAEARIIALRSFGKFYGLPGVRLGFITGHPALIRMLRSRLGDWPVSADAIAAGRLAYPDSRWAEATPRQLAEDAVRLDGLLQDAGFDIVGGCALFRLAAAPDASERFHRLARAGVLTRPFAYDPTWLRFGLPARADWSRLERVLKEMRRE